MRKLLAVILIAMAGWSGYWFVAAQSAKSGFAAWFEDRRADGWVAEYGTLTVRGYPNRIDTVFDALTLADPETGLAWDAPTFRLFALSYRPNHVIAVWPPDQTLATPLEKLRLTNRDMRASLVLESDTDLALRRTTLTAEDLAITRIDTQETTAIAALTLAAEKVAVDAAPRYRLGVQADGLAPSLPWRAQLDPRDALPDRFEALRADFFVTFDKPWNRSAIEEARPQPGRIEVRLAEARWGKLELQLAGELSVDKAGQPDGTLMIKARNWRDILQLAVNSGALGEGFASTLEDGLSLVAGLAGNPQTLDIPLDFRRGRVFLGPVPLGPAPVIRLR